MMCDEYHGLISGYLDQAISPRQQGALLEHLERCPPCAATFARYRQIGVLLSHLPSSKPTEGVRDLVLKGGPNVRRGWWPTALPAVTGAVAALAIAFGLWSGQGIGGQQPADGVASPAPPGVSSTSSTRTDDSRLADSGRVVQRAEDSSQVPVGDDAVMLQQVRVTVRRPGFRPMAPAYLPMGARLDAVNFGRLHPTGPIDRLEVAFATDNRKIRLSQFSGDAAEIERKQLEARQRWQPPKRVVVGGREWVYLQRDDAERGVDSTVVLIGQRDGMTIWVESSLPVEELARVAASLQD